MPSRFVEGLCEIPERPDDTALLALRRLGIETGDQRAYLRAHLTRMPGWAAHIRWQAEHGGGIDLVSWLAMRLTYEAGLLENEFGPDGSSWSL